MRRKACIGELGSRVYSVRPQEGGLTPISIGVDEKCPAELRFVRFWKQQAEWVVVGEAFNGRHAIETVDEYLPHITVIYFVMPEMDGLEIPLHDAVEARGKILQAGSIDIIARSRLADLCHRLLISRGVKISGMRLRFPD